MVGDLLMASLTESNHINPAEPCAVHHPYVPCTSKAIVLPLGRIRCPTPIPSSHSA